MSWPPLLIPQLRRSRKSGGEPPEGDDTAGAGRSNARFVRVGKGAVRQGAESTLGRMRRAYSCPECDEPIAFAFRDTSGQGGHKRGDAFNTTPDTDHYVCLLCLKAWKQRLDGPLTPDVVGELTFFTCREPTCGARLDVTRESGAPAGTELACAAGHRYVVVAMSDGALGLDAV